MTGSLSRRRLLALAGGAAGAAALGGCVQGSATRTTGRGVTMWYAFGSDAHRNYFQKHFVDAYNRGRRVPVQLTVKDSSTLERLQQTAIASGVGPEIVFTSGPSVAVQYVRAGKLRPLDGYARRYGWADKLQQWAYDAGRNAGKLYSLPTSYESIVTYYNRATFDRYGWTPPTDRHEFEALCADAKGRNMIPVGAGSAGWPATTEWYVSLFLNYLAGPEAVYRALRGEVRWTDPVFVDTVATLAGYFTRGWFGGQVSDYFTNRADAMHTALAGGTVAMEMVGTWAFSDLPIYFTGHEAEWDWAPAPRFAPHVPADAYPLGAGGTFSINADARHPDAAADYLDWLLSDRGRQGRAVAEDHFEPLPLLLTESDFPTSTDPRVRRFYVDVARARHMGYLSWTFWPPRTETWLFEKFDKVITGQISPQEYCAGMDRVFRAELAAGNVPPVPSPGGDIR